MVESGALPPAGWYPDPRDPSSRRWWDGLAWTGHVRTPEPAPVVAPVAVAVLERPAEISSAEYARRAAGYAPRAPEAVPYAPATLSSTPLTVRGSLQTLPGWLIAVSPVWYGGLATIVGGLALAASPTGGRLYVFPLLGVFITALILLARVDAARLNERGHTPPSPRWAWLPIVYLILRVVRTGSASAWMLAVYVFTQLAYVIITVVVALAIILPAVQPADTSSPSETAPLSAAERDYYLTTDGMAEAVTAGLSGVLVVDSVQCAPFLDLTPGTMTQCVATGSGSTWTATLVISDASGDFPYYIADLQELGGDSSVES